MEESYCQGRLEQNVCCTDYVLQFIEICLRYVEQHMRNLELNLCNVNN